MKDKESSTESKMSLAEIFRQSVSIFLRYAVVVFVVIVFAVYSFLLYQITTAHDAAPSQSDIDAKLQTVATPRIDPQIVKEMQSLQDNSVNVQSLFDQARSNPFKE